MRAQTPDARVASGRRQSHPEQRRGGADQPLLAGRLQRRQRTTALAAAAALGVDPAVSATAFKEIETVGRRYALVQHGRHGLRLLLTKNPAGWTETLRLIDPASSLLLVVNAREADGRDTSWLGMSLPQPRSRSRPRGRRGRRRTRSRSGPAPRVCGVEQRTVPDPLAALSSLPAGRGRVLKPDRVHGCRTDRTRSTQLSPTPGRQQAARITSPSTVSATRGSASTPSHRGQIKIR